MIVRGDLISFRGIKEGIYIYIKKGEFHDIKKELDRKLREYIDFFKGANILGVKGDGLLQNQIDELTALIKNEYKFHVSQEGLPQSLEKQGYYMGIDEGMTKFINSTIRSGQVIEYHGNVVIIGDVNPGALIRAKGNIVILGALRGVAHAGTDGNEKAMVAAYNLQPTQLRIANIISRKPDEEVTAPGLPEVARIYNGEVFIEPYLRRK